MKNLTKLSIAGASLVAASGLSAQSFTVAAFDFDKLSAAGVFADSPSFTDQGSYVADNIGSGFSATLYVDGSFGSTDIASLSGADPLGTNFGEDVLNRATLDFGNLSGTTQNPEAFGINTTDTASFTFALSLGSNVFDSSAADSFSFVARADGGSAGANLSWDYSTNGGASFTALSGFNQTLGTAYTAYSTNGLDGLSGDVLVRGTYSGGATGAGQTFGLDNVQFNGSVVPEPSSFAAILGALALGVTATRRRSKK
jgi:hypothetical protein